MTTNPSDVYTLAQWLAGDHSNWEQAIDNPPFFAHIRVGIRALPNPITDDGVWLFLEQAYDYEVTDERVWGSIAGAFQFVKKTSFSNEITIGSTS